MNKFEEAKLHADMCTVESYNILIDFITSCEETEKKYDELVKDVKRFIELQSKVYKLYNATENEANDLVGLLNKLSKVGEKE